jgi:hypothetical protein
MLLEEVEKGRPDFVDAVHRLTDSREIGRGERRTGNALSLEDQSSRVAKNRKGPA